MQVSPNFAFLKAHDLQLVRLGAQAERHFAEDPNTCLRQLAEELLRVAEAEAAEIKAKLIGIQAQTVAQKAPVIQQSIANAQQNGRYLDLFASNGNGDRQNQNQYYPRLSTAEN
ncbi:hypothetical protein [Chamaesiphon sp. OTE_75_metabat_556]|uniref:hypothetical protein n=1 Tax=Chamaesiphon sp. OTE_75_metabat_556 TaxID=2964692 RepID=UPI00286BA356|nr:hypothetical protein [Chamaesiphon sp. OTE_75_metabat_556]